AMAAVVLAAALASHRTRRSLLSHPGRREAVLRRYGAWRMYHVFGLCGLFFLAVYCLGWGWTVQEACQMVRWGGQETIMFPRAELLILAPFVVALLLSWACFYDAERALQATSPTADGPSPPLPFWSRRAYVGFHAP